MPPVWRKWCVVAVLWRLLVVLFLSTVYAVRLALRCAWRIVVGIGSIEEVLGEESAALCEALGPTFIKVGQILSCRPDLLGAETASPLARLQHQLSPFGSRSVKRCLSESYPAPISEIFHRFDLDPLLAASIAQVHRARLKDGTEVAVKIRRPGVVQTVHRDFQIARWIARALESVPLLKAAPICDVTREVFELITQQLDFRREADNYRRFRASFRGQERIRFPRVFDEFSTESILVLEFMDGLRKVTDPELSASQRAALARTGLRLLYKMIFVDGFVHADMHPGNVFVRRGDLVLLDVGMTAVLSGQEREEFANFFFGIVNHDGKECARVILDTAAICTNSFDRSAFEAAMEDLVARHSSLRSRDFEVPRFVFELMAIQHRFGVRGSTRFITTVLAMVVFDGICKQLHPECDFLAEARGFLIVARYSSSAVSQKSR